MVLKDCIECMHGEVIILDREYYSKCHHENCLSIHSKCIARRALLKYYDLRQILSIHAIKEAYHEGSHYRYAQDTTRERLGTKNSDSTEVPSSQETTEETTVFS